MAAPGVGDVLTAIQILYSVYKTCKDAPPAVELAMADVKQMRTELESMQHKAEDPKTFIYKDKGKMLARVKETFPPLLANLKTMTSLIADYKHIPPYSGQKLIFAYLKVPLIKDIQVNFVRYRAIYSSAFQHVGAEADGQIAAEVAALKAQQEDGNAKLDQLLKNYEALQAAQAAAPSPSVGEAATEEWEARLRALGLNDKEVRRIIAALKFDAIPPISVTPSPGAEKPVLTKQTTKKDKGGAPAGDGALKVPSRPRASSQPRKPTAKSQSPGPDPKKKRAPSPSPPPTIAKPSSPQPKSPSPKPKGNQKASAWKPPPKPEDARILCVDRTNGFRSLVSQTYLQLLRLQTATASTPPGHTWLFHSVSSCGLNRPSPLATSAQIPIYVPPSAAARESAIKAITGTAGYFWSDNYPFEKGGVLKRVREQGIRGLAERDFEKCDYMLCFTDDVYAELVELIKMLKKQKTEKGGSDVKARVVLIPGTEWFIGSKHTHEQDIEEVMTNLKKGVREWLTKALGWERPPRDKPLVNTVAGVQWRTVQTVVPGKCGKALEKRFHDIRGGKVVELEGCWVRWEELGSDGEKLVSITGNREKLREAEEWVKGLR